MAVAMSSVPPPPDRDERASASGARGTPARRPRYLVVALIGALLFGAGCWTEGCGRLAFYRGEPDHRADMTDSIHDDMDRAQARAMYQRFIDVADNYRNRAIPMAAATFVLGAALLALAARGLAGKSNTRSALMQVVTAQAVLVVASYFVTRPIFEAETDWQYELVRIQQRERMPPEQFEHVVPTLRAMRRWVPPGWLVIRTVASAMILVALTRPRVREFYEAAARPVSER